MATVNVYPTNIYLGTTGRDVLRVGSDATAVGLDGDDTLASQGWGMTALLGGAGNDRYYAEGMVSQITDNGGNDTLVLSGLADDYTGGFVNGQHLLLYNAKTGHNTLVMDFKGAGRIETFIDANRQQVSADEIETYVYQQGRGDIAFNDLQYASGYYNLNESTFNAALEMDMVFGRLDWKNVFQRLTERGLSDSPAIADAVQAEAFLRLSPAAQQVWQESGVHQALAGSTFHGLENHLSISPSLPSLSRAQVENISLLYEAALDRRPDEPGLNYFANNLKSGQSLQDIARSFYQADEFRAQFQQFDNASYVNQLYQNVLGRSADAAGLEYWLNNIEQPDTSPADVLVGFALSTENRANAADWLAGLHYDTPSDSWTLA